MHDSLPVCPSCLRRLPHPVYAVDDGDKALSFALALALGLIVWGLTSVLIGFGAGILVWLVAMGVSHAAGQRKVDETYRALRQRRERYHDIEVE